MLDRLDEEIAVMMKVLEQPYSRDIMSCVRPFKCTEKVGIAKYGTGSRKFPLLNDSIDVKWFVYDFPDKNIIPSTLVDRCAWDRNERVLEIYAASSNERLRDSNLPETARKCFYMIVEEELYESTLINESNFSIAHRKFVECQSEIEAAIAKVILINNEWIDDYYIKSDLEELEKFIQKNEWPSSDIRCEGNAKAVRKMHLFDMAVNMRASKVIINNYLTHHDNTTELLSDYKGITEDIILEAVSILENNIVQKIGFNVAKILTEEKIERRKHVLF